MEKNHFNPLAPSQLHEKTPQKNLKQPDLFFTFSEPLLKAYHHKFWAFKEWILTIKDVYENSVINNPLAVSLLERYHHAFPEEIPSGVPLKWDVEHHIDVILEAILLNKSAYRMNPKDITEIQRQVEELISKGLV